MCCVLRLHFHLIRSYDAAWEYKFQADTKFNYARKTFVEIVCIIYFACEMRWDAKAARVCVHELSRYLGASRWYWASCCDTHIYHASQMHWIRACVVVETLFSVANQADAQMGRWIHFEFKQCEIEYVARNSWLCFEAKRDAINSQVTSDSINRRKYFPFGRNKTELPMWKHLTETDLTIDILKWQLWSVSIHLYPHRSVASTTIRICQFDELPI